MTAHNWKSFLLVLVLSAGCGTAELVGDAGKKDDAGGPAACTPATATAGDSCGAGKHCVQGACVAAGCASGAACASGVCLPTNDCLNCRGDAECAAGRLCGSGTCAAACTVSCASGWACCNGRCVDRSRDPAYCGACATQCTEAEFCGRSECHRSVLSNVCALPAACTVLDGQSADDVAGALMTSALVTSCPRPVTSCTVAAGDLDVTTGTPLVLGKLFVVAGGSFRQKAIGWLETNNLLPVRDTSTTAVYSYTLRDGRLLATGPAAEITPSHEVLVVQFVRLASGVTLLHAAGYYAPGTSAAVWYVVNRLLPQLSTEHKSWYVLDWRDANANLQPDAADTWTLIEAG